MAMGTDFDRKMEKRMAEISKKMDAKFAKFGMEPRKPTRPEPRYESNGFFTKKSKNNEGSIIVDGQKIKVENGQTVIVQGSVIELSIQNADNVKVEGTVKMIKNQNSDIDIKTVHGEVHNQNGDIKIGSMNGSGKCTAHNGDVIIKHKVEGVTAEPIKKEVIGFVPDYYKSTVKSHLMNGGVISQYKQSNEGELVKVITENTKLDWTNYFYMINDTKTQKHKTSGKCYIKD